MPVYRIEGLVPVVDPGAFVHETAVLIGDVIIADRCYVGPNAVLRGDFGRIVMEEGSNLQDTCVAHTFPGKDCIIEVDGHVGHGAVLHGCRIGRNALVGMNAVVMDDAVIGAESIVGAMAFVRSGFTCPERSMVVGSPARVIRAVRETEVQWKSLGTKEYQQLGSRCRLSLEKVEPLAEPEPDRPRINISEFKPKNQL
ncbi:MAG: phenylacetic acid degradation protein PaaY [Xanthomonadales bacterium]